MIECDGGQHYTDDGLDADRVRDRALAGLGLMVLRFDNLQILNEIDGVVEQIYCVVEQGLELIKLESPSCET